MLKKVAMVLLKIYYYCLFKNQYILFFIVLLRSITCGILQKAQNDVRYFLFNAVDEYGRNSVPTFKLYLLSFVTFDKVTTLEKSPADL